jgi:3',5'-nucleoside bisphosphate phosphatase
MPIYCADLHIHTVLSPCGDLGMSPVNIVKTALEKGLNIIGITDHNSTLHCQLIQKTASEHGIMVMMGAEVTTKEEIHCLTFFENTESLNAFQQYLDKYLPHFPNDEEKFGYQVVVNEKEEILQHIEWLLISAIDQSIDEVEAKVHSLGGLFIPAHIDKSCNSLISQLGFIPPSLNIDGLEISKHAKPENLAFLTSVHHNVPILRNSDAHVLEQIGTSKTEFLLEKLSLSEVRMALRKENGRDTFIL